VATNPEAEVVYRAEAILEQELPTRKLSLKEAQDLVDQIAHAEDSDPPKVLHLPISPRFDAIAVPDERVIVLRTKRPTQLTIVHEMAHFLTGTGHGMRFHRMYLVLIRRYLSLTHSQILKSALKLTASNTDS
jgi:hypothetical protein